jgi:hypothetical protein
MREAELRRVLGAFDAAGLPVLLIKGAALAHTHYPEAYLRPRRDTDLLVDPGDLAAIRRVLAEQGYAPPDYKESETLLQQFHCGRVDAYGLHHTFDVHWRIANTRLFAELFTFEELHARGVPVPALHPGARAPRAVDALLLACIHRVAHHNDRGDVIWILDIDLLARALTPAQGEELRTTAAEKQVRQICARGLALARHWFGTPWPGDMSAWVSDQLTADRLERSAAFLHEEQRQIDIFMSDLSAVRGWRERLHFVRDHVLPSASFMFRSYGTSSRALLPALYTHRLARGAWRWFRRLDAAGGKHPRPRPERSGGA